ncbi:MAG: hypothetical protein MRZ54_05275 [Clostridiales bacterium]|nr:hypothetical protein [Clostridiales bacterium]
MNYALVENGVVVNVIWLYEGNAHEFAGAVPVNDRPVQIGDTYENGVFYHEGERVLSTLEQTEQAHAAYEEKLKLQEAQIQALSDRNEFMEDCVAEMAGVVYGG